MNAVPAIKPMRTIVLSAWYLTASALPAFGSRYCDACAGMPWWEEPLLVVAGFVIAILLLAGLARADAWFSRRRAPKGDADPPDENVR